MFDTNTLFRVLIFMCILVGAWIILKAIFRIAGRVFFFGCGAILVLGVILIILNMLGR